MNASIPSPLVDAAHDPRLQALRSWLAALPGSEQLDLASLRPASSDASFRRYFRIDARSADGRSVIAMDAPPPQEDCEPFVRVAELFATSGLHVPAMLASDLEHGFLLLEDLGTTTLLDRLNEAPPASEVESRYAQAGEALVTLQLASQPGVLPDYDRALLERELMLLPQWFLSRHCGLAEDGSSTQVLRGAFDALLQNNLRQPAVFVHRDWHSRNLMIDRERPEAPPGVIDFQDAVYGPITYDLVSLLRDAYVRWPEEVQIDRAVRWWELARRRGLPVRPDFGEFWIDFEWMGLQRHLKVLGIFARLWHRDGKDRYLADIPLVLQGATAVARRYAPFAGLARILELASDRMPASG